MSPSPYCTKNPQFYENFTVSGAPEVTTTVPVAVMASTGDCRGADDLGIQNQTILVVRWLWYLRTTTLTSATSCSDGRAAP
jgi:hypothetical protein